jgi:hypothetical protein
MKDVVSCDKLRLGANNLSDGDFRMGQPTRFHRRVSAAEYIGGRGERGELKHLSNLRKRK